MKILFIDSPPSLDWTPQSSYTKGGRRFPALTVTGECSYNYLNLSCAAVLRNDKHEVNYIDCQAEGLTVSQLISEVSELAPSVVIMYVEQIKMSVDIEIARQLKEALAPFIVFVGPFVTPLASEILRSCPNVDAILRGEYDYAISEVIKCIEEKREMDSVTGLAYRKNSYIKQVGNVRHVEDLNKLPIPAYDLIDFTKYRESVFQRMPVATIITSRGCPYPCIYCWFPQTIYSHKWRCFNTERVIKEIKYLVSEFGVRELRLDDDIFEMDRQRVLAICAAIKKEKVDITWAPQCRPDLVDKELLHIMKDAGCTRILYGCESGSQQVLDAIRKQFKVEDIIKAHKLTREAGIDIHACYMLGFPWDTKETIEQTIRLAYELNAEFCQFAVPTPLPGTEFYKIAEEKGYLLTDNWKQYDGFSKAAVSFPHMEQKEIEEYAHRAYHNYYVRPRYVWMMFKRAFRSKDTFVQTLRGARALLLRKRMGWS